MEDQARSPRIQFADDVDPDEPINPLFRQRSRADTIGHQWNANTSFEPTPDETPQSWSPTRAGSNASSGIELLRRLSLVNSQPIDLNYDPRAAYPSLNLTGRVISATFCIPYGISHAADGNDPWVSCSPYPLCLLLSVHRIWSVVMALLLFSTLFHISRQAHLHGVIHYLAGPERFVVHLGSANPEMRTAGPHWRLLH